MSIPELYLIAMLIIFTIPYLIWKVFKTDYFAPLVVIQIISGIVLGPGVLGGFYPDYYNTIFTSEIISILSGIAWWAVMIFVFLAGVELDLSSAWRNRRESGITAGLALGVPVSLGILVGVGLTFFDGWIGQNATHWQFIIGIGMSCAVTSLPILVLFMEKLDIFKGVLGQRILRYASLDDIAIWAVLAIILMDWGRIGKQFIFLSLFFLLAKIFRKIALKISEADRLYACVVWLILCSFGADWCGLHFMVGAFLAGVVVDSSWFSPGKMDSLRSYIFILFMPVFFLSTGLKTNWEVGGFNVIIIGGILLIASVMGKIIGVKIAGSILNWSREDSHIVGWLLQTKGLILIVFANILLDKMIITNEMFTALLLMAVGSNMLTIPFVYPALQKSQYKTGSSVIAN